MDQQGQRGYAALTRDFFLRFTVMVSIIGTVIADLPAVWGILVFWRAKRPIAQRDLSALRDSRGFAVGQSHGAVPRGGGDSTGQTS